MKIVVDDLHVTGSHEFSGLKTIFFFLYVVHLILQFSTQLDASHGLENFAVFSSFEFTSKFLDISGEKKPAYETPEAGCRIRFSSGTLCLSSFY